jgi:hypothetical protein
VEAADPNAEIQWESARFMSQAPRRQTKPPAMESGATCSCRNEHSEGEGDCGDQEGCAGGAGGSEASGGDGDAGSEGSEGEKPG